MEHEAGKRDEMQSREHLWQAGDPNEPGAGPVQPEISIILTDLRQVLATCKA